MSGGDTEILQADSGDAEALTAIAHEAKRHWGYSDELIARWRSDLTFTPEYIAANTVYLAKAGDRTVGVYALLRSDPHPELAHLWVAPDCHGLGVGRALVEHAIATARGWDATSIKIVSDPHAEGFYVKMGASRVGDVASTPSGRRLPLLRLDLARSRQGH